MCFSFTAHARHRLGLLDWSVVEGWMDPVTEVTSSEPSPASEPKLKCPKLPILESNQFLAPSSF
jgi:hypothetical protein